LPPRQSTPEAPHSREGKVVLRDRGPLTPKGHQPWTTYGPSLGLAKDELPYGYYFPLKSIDLMSTLNNFFLSFPCSSLWSCLDQRLNDVKIAVWGPDQANPRTIWTDPIGNEMGYSDLDCSKHIKVCTKQAKSSKMSQTQAQKEDFAQVQTHDYS